MGNKEIFCAGKSLIYDFLIYIGANSSGGEKCTPDSVVLQLVKPIPKPKQHQLSFDNWFST